MAITRFDFFLATRKIIISFLSRFYTGNFYVTTFIYFYRVDDKQSFVSSPKFSATVMTLDSRDTRAQRPVGVREIGDHI